MNILAIDYGRRFLGLAFFKSGYSSVDPVLPLPALRFESRGQILNSILKVCQDYQIDGLVFGLPYSPEGRPGSLDFEIRRFAFDLSRATRISKINFVDESLTSFEAARNLSGIKSSKRRAAENSLAAQLILENFLRTLEK